MIVFFEISPSNLAYQGHYSHFPYEILFIQKISLVIIFMCRFMLYKNYGVTQNLHNSYNNALVLKIAIENPHSSNEYRKEICQKKNDDFQILNFRYVQACLILV